MNSSKELAGVFSTEISALSNPRILIDGLSGSGKTTFAHLLVNEIFALTQLKPQIVHMDDLYPGWEGLEAGSRLLVSQILEPLARGTSAQFQIWDWSRETRGSMLEPGNGWRTVSSDAPLIVEGCGAVSIESRALANHAIWIEASPEDRLERLTVRDPDSFRVHQELWSSQEQDFYKAQGTVELCEYRVIN